ncbi:ACP S-malonyltransferase [Oscillibacter sp. MSJ-2]|uniref:Malonyl CoA-acyl carrier protein transacylase n=1 Tax=Dysosmobacter acutus TaxID=2841504 RepID=A0ABS6FBF7_9FIRM|nr:ACP S-malonyltransferase [Dysosmobacter acutus]MBU5626664.1 ACP S-malonyltransferase [Dysosmobacter acutus]
MKLGFLYAGQGVQHVGMGADLYALYPEFRTVIDASRPGFDLRAVSFDGPEELLNQTRYTQPCMVAFAAGLTAVLRRLGIAPSVTAGLSLGEYSALHAAGVLDAQAAVSTAAFRGAAMADAARGVECAMVAVLGLDRSGVAEACAQASRLGVAEACNFNCPGQVVISGEAAAVVRAAKLCKEKGARRCLPLKVSGPFHTSLLRGAGDALRSYFETVPFAPPAIPVLFNCLGREMGPGDSIPALLERQVQSPVYLEECIRRMAQLEVDAVVEIGPGKTLAGFVRKTVPGLPCFSVETAEDVPNLPEQLKGVSR